MTNSSIILQKASYKIQPASLNSYNYLIYQELMVERTYTGNGSKVLWIFTLRFSERKQV
jgi:hypothetical protein